MNRIFAKMSRCVWIVTMSVVSLIMVYPFIYSLLAGLMDKKDFGNLGTLLPIPRKIVLSNLLYIFTPTGIRPLLNTVLRTTWYMVIVTLMAILVGYVMARYEFKGKKMFFMIIICSQVVPGVLTLIPSFVMVSKIPLVGGNNWIGLGGRGLINNILMLYLPLGWDKLLWVFLFIQAMRSLPKEFEEAAEMDGCGFWRTIFRILVPMQKPIIAVIAVNTALTTWNDWMTPFIYINRIQDSTLPAYLGMLTAQLQAFGDRDYPKLFALANIAIVPPFLIFLFMQKYIIQGIASAGIKG